MQSSFRLVFHPAAFEKYNLFPARQVMLMSSYFFPLGQRRHHSDCAYIWEWFNQVAVADEKSRALYFRFGKNKCCFQTKGVYTNTKIWYYTIKLAR